MKVLTITDQIREILKTAKVSNVVRLKQMSDDEYDSIKLIMESLDTHWRQVELGFKYECSPNEIRKRINDIMKKEFIEIDDTKEFKIDNQFYQTPDWLAEKMVNMAGIKCGDKVLEPSAGLGAIAKYIKLKTNNLSLIEPNKDNVHRLRKMGFSVNHTTLEQFYKRKMRCQVLRKYDKIIMNPPFSNERDINHIRLAYDLLGNGGKIVAIMAENSLYYNRESTREFNRWLVKVNAQVIPLPKNTFKESGTLVDVVMAIINKNMAA